MSGTRRCRSTSSASDARCRRIESAPLRLSRAPGSTSHLHEERERMIRRFTITVAVALIATVSLAQQAVPTPEQFLGYNIGDRFTPWDRIIDYFDALTKSSNLITMQTFGHTYEGRPLVLVTITSPKNRANLDAIRQNVGTLAYAGVDANRAAEIAKSSPAIAWLGFGIHGNESSSAETAMRVASTLLHD